MSIINPDEDGITHINIYSKGKTELGRLLSNFAYTPVKLEHGKFDSLEGYWYWLLSKQDDEASELRYTYGWQAKSLGRKLKVKDYPTDDNLHFFAYFQIAMGEKLHQHPRIDELLIDSTLPFKHYYVYNGKVKDETERCQWMIDFWDMNRK